MDWTEAASRRAARTCPALHNSEGQGCFARHFCCRNQRGAPLARLLRSGITQVRSPAAVGKRGGVVGKRMEQLLPGELARTTEIRAPEISRLQLGSSEAGSPQFRKAEIAAAQPGFPKIRVPQDRIAEDALQRFRPIELRVLQFGS